MKNASENPDKKAKQTHRKTVVMTGIAGSLGRAVARALHRSYNIIGIDPRPAKYLPKDVAHYRFDYRRRPTEDIFRRHKVHALLHLGMIHRLYQNSDDAYGFNVVGTQKLLEFCSLYGVKKMCLLSTADVYGPLPGRSHFITEDTTLQGDVRYPEMRTLVTIDRMVQNCMYKNRNIETCILRPTHIIGPQLKNATTTYLRMPFAPVIFGFDPMLQVIHQKDLIAAIGMSLASKVYGVFNLSSTEAAPLRRLLERLDKKIVPVPAFLFRSVIERMWRYNILAFPPPEVDHLQYNYVLDTTQAKQELGFKPTYTWPKIIKELQAMLRNG